MKNLIRLISNKFNLIKPKMYEKNIFTIFAQKKSVIEKADTKTIDTELIIELPENCTAFLATKFKGQDIQKFTGLCRKRLWLTILNQSYSNNHIYNHYIESVILDWIPIIRTRQFKCILHRERESCQRKKAKCPNNYIPKDWSKRWKNYFKKKR